jgi:hypothetical protein
MALKEKITAAVEEYVSTPEAWDDAQLTIDPASGTVELVEQEEAENLPDSIDVYDIMDLVEMDAEGAWKPDAENIAEVAAEYDA